ncbi:MAG: bifunctional nuclease family protein [Saprospiraceae bacterium]|jgi:bifunctional DNase/RNase|nr:bifunctional nuclease family protein [Saprospiraceae bacterium]
MKKVELQIVALSHSVTQSHNYAVVLGEKEGLRRLPIVIGGFEAQAIAVAMEKMSPNRPLTHDLLKNAFDTFNIDVKEIVINNLLDGIFYARLVCERDGEEVEIDSRTSDAIALAVRYDCPIYTFEFILEAAGVILEEPEGGEKPKKRELKKKKDDLTSVSIEDLQNMLDEMLANEDYEKAAKIRDEINQRKQLGQ